MKKEIISLLFCMPFLAVAETKTVKSPDGKLCVSIDLTDGNLTYSVTNEGRQVLMPSSLGLVTDMGDYTKSLTLKASKEGRADYTYSMRGTKASGNHYVANAIEMTFSIPSPKGKAEKGVSPRDMKLEMQVSNGNIAYRYHFDGATDNNENIPRRVTILSEASAFKFPTASAADKNGKGFVETTTFLCPQIDGNNTGWMGTKPSYEEEYKADAPMTDKSQYGHGYTFPCLFHIKNSIQGESKDESTWVLVSETGVSSSYCGGHLSDYDAQKGYTLSFPDQTENHGLGSTTPSFLLPGETPWRTITIGSTLKPIVETTIPYDVVEERYPAHASLLTSNERPGGASGRYTWSWLIWQDKSINYNDQVKFIDVASAMGFEYCLVDNWWDTQIGRDRIAELSKYAQSKGVSLMLWYNSNGYANNAPQGPRNCMNTAIAREKEMTWLESIGVKGIKVDFFGGDKQETMRLYEDILSDANRHGIQVIFHGCTLPRGWERMYPNFVASEAVLASENVYFSEHHAKAEGFELTMHPFCRNAVASMDWGGTIMNHWLNKGDEPNKGHRRYTSDTFEMAAAIINQTTIQCICMQPSNLDSLKQYQLDFLKAVPTTWQQTQYIDGYPGKFVVLARQSLNSQPSTLNPEPGKWYVAGLNGETTPKALTLNLPMFSGKTVNYYYDQKTGESSVKTAKVDKHGNIKVQIPGMGGIIITE